MSTRGEYYKYKYANKRRHTDDQNEKTVDMDDDQIDDEMEYQGKEQKTFSHKELLDYLHQIDGRGYGAYKDLVGRYEFPKFSLIIDRVQRDPFAPPSNFRVLLKKDVANFPKDTFSNRVRSTALSDYLTRSFYHYAKEKKYDVKKGDHWGSQKGGEISMQRPSQHIIERSSVLISKEGDIEARFTVGLPAQGRTVLGKWAGSIMMENIPNLVENTLFFNKLDSKQLYQHILSNEDQDYLRNQLKKAGLVAFVRDGAVLPRESGVSDKPMQSGNVVVFKSPATMKREFTLPNAGKITGMGIPQGVTVIVGGGFHGKTTILNAIEMGIYNHIPGDGREFVVTDPNAVKIRAEDGRSISCVDISPFIDNLPFNKSTKQFSTPDASGSTSQAANIMEALELGASTLLIDEDTSATNFMIRDKRMQLLVSKDKEPITPFIYKVRNLFKDHSVSCVLVIGGSGDYFDVADTVIMMNSYSPEDVTANAKQIASQFPTGLVNEGGKTFGIINHRYPSMFTSKDRDFPKITTPEVTKLRIGYQDVDLDALEQLTEVGQTQCIARAILTANASLTGNVTLNALLDKLEDDFQKQGLDAVNNIYLGSLAKPRKIEIGAAINRLRTLKVQMK